MTGDKAVELINEWLNLAKEIGDMNLNRMEYDEERYNYAMDRMDVIRQEINEYPELAKQMDNKVGIDESIESFVKLPEPERTRESRSSRDWDIEL